MKTKKEAFEEYLANEVGMFQLTSEVFSAGWDAATQQLEAERKKHDQEMLEFLRFSAIQQQMWVLSDEDLLTKFRQSKQQ